MSRTKKVIRVVGADETGLCALRAAGRASRFEFQPLFSREELTGETAVPFPLLLDERLSELQAHPPAALVASRDSTAMKIARYLGLQIGLHESSVFDSSPLSRDRHRATEPSLAPERVPRPVELDPGAVGFGFCIPPEFPLWLTWTHGIPAGDESRTSPLPSLETRPGRSLGIAVL